MTQSKVAKIMFKIFPHHSVNTDREKYICAQTDHEEFAVKIADLLHGYVWKFENRESRLYYVWTSQGGGYVNPPRGKKKHSTPKVKKNSLTTFMRTL